MPSKKRTTSKRTTKKRKIKKLPNCPEGKILRSGYTRHGYTRVSKSGKSASVRKAYVPPACIPGLHGRSLKGIPLIQLRDKDILKPYGYATKKPKSIRRKAIDKAIKQHGKLFVLRYMNVLRTYNKHRESIYNKFDEDVKYIQKNYFNERWLAKKRSSKKSTRKSKRSTKKSR